MADTAREHFVAEAHVEGRVVHFYLDHDLMLAMGREAVRRGEFTEGPIRAVAQGQRQRTGAIHRVPKRPGQRRPS